jgi:hypothetical protein
VPDASGEDASNLYGNGRDAEPRTTKFHARNRGKIARANVERITI